MAVEFAHFVSGPEIRASHPLYTKDATSRTDGATANGFSANICLRQVAPVAYGGYGVMAALGVVDPSAAGRNRLVAPQIASTHSPIDTGSRIGVDAPQSTIETSSG